MKVLYTIAFILMTFLFTGTAYSQSILTNLGNIEVDITHSNKIIAIHSIDKGETLYSIAKFYKVSLDELMKINNIQKDQIVSINSQIKVPIYNELINKSGVKQDPSWIPVIYTIKKKETLYTIGKKYFSQDIDDLNQRNDINSFIIHENEKLIIGWWTAKDNHGSEPNFSQTIAKKQSVLNSEYIETENIDSTKIQSIQEKVIAISESIKENNTQEKPLLQPLKTLSSKSLPRLSKVYKIKGEEFIIIDSSRLVATASDSSSIIEDPRTKISKKGICIWMKDDPETKQLLAFHKSAEIGSKITVNYPLTNRNVDVIVIDNIKPNLYPDDVEIIVTKAVALELGARDSRIQINMDYYQ